MLSEILAGYVALEVKIMTICKVHLKILSEVL